ncbi:MULTISPECIES: PD-(D/E)XK nuclease family transposase [Butyricimonas]|uniref:PD-(D/E)XK nuclease family transposase n=1 Tax=Butyricimonas TaxID=574697 RepID=UPI000A73157F|nr:PD-(D/E)XK nuclease family transposase [Butyricimonas synergistica]
MQFYECEGDYHLPYPTYSLNLVNEIFEPEMQEYYPHYKLVHNKDSNKVIDGLQLVFVELPKFTPHTYAEKKMQVLWLRYLTEIGEHTVSVPEELHSNPEVNKVVKAIEEAAFSPAQLLEYEKFWDIISTKKTLFYSAEQKGLASGMEKVTGLPVEEIEAL